MLVDTRAVEEGTIERDGVRIGFQVFGRGPRALLLLPTWPIVHSDLWRAQMPHLAPRYRVVTFDGRGNGASDRPEDVASYTGPVAVADALAVLDAVHVGRAAVLSVSLGAFWAALLATDHPERIAASAFIAPYLPLGPQTAERAAAEASFDAPRPRYEGWQKWNRHYWHEDWPGFLEFFFSQCFTEPDSRSYVDHFIGMGLQTTPSVIALTEDADDLDGTVAHGLARAIRARPSSSTATRTRSPPWPGGATSRGSPDPSSTSSPGPAMSRSSGRRTRRIGCSTGSSRVSGLQRGDPGAHRFTVTQADLRESPRPCRPGRSRSRRWPSSR